MTFNSAFEIVTTTAGATSIKDIAGGEIIHNPVGPWKESRTLYVKQAKLEERLLLPKKEPLALYDVGLGAGFNALASIEVAQHLFLSKSLKRKLHIVSFESDMGLFDFMLSNLDAFPESLIFEKELKAFRTNGHFENEYLIWQLKGKLTEKELEASLPQTEIIFFDPYSPKVNPDSWTIPIFRSLKQKMTGDVSACLVTYSNATRIRTAMLLGGLFVGQGETSGMKLETTFAGSKLSELAIPLGERWLLRWTRSHEALPLGAHGLSHKEVFLRLKAHPQFENTKLANFEEKRE